MAVFLNAETTKEGSGIAFGVPSFKLSEFLLKFCGFDAIFIREILFCVYCVLLLHNVPKNSMPAQYCLDDGAFVKFEVILTQY